MTQKYCCVVPCVQDVFALFYLLRLRIITIRKKNTWSLALASLTVADLGCEMLIADLVSIVCVIYNVYN